MIGSCGSRPPEKRTFDHLVTHETCHSGFGTLSGTDCWSRLLDLGPRQRHHKSASARREYGRMPLDHRSQGLTWLPSHQRPERDLRLAGYYDGCGPAEHGARHPVSRGRWGMSGRIVSLLTTGRESHRNDSEPPRSGAVSLHVLQKVYPDYSYKTFRYYEPATRVSRFDPGGSTGPSFPRRWLTSIKTPMGCREVHVGTPTPKSGQREFTVELRQTGTNGGADVVPLPSLAPPTSAYRSWA